ncbi:hypothetical protein D3C85_1213890 [compost metagenome]
MDGVVFFQRFDRVFHSLQKRVGCPKDARVIGQAACNERQGFAAQRLLDQHWIYVEHAVTEALISAGHAIVKLIRMEHQRSAGKAVPHGAAVTKALHTGQCSTDGIGVMPMGFVTVAGEIGLDSFHLARKVTMEHPVSLGGACAHYVDLPSCIDRRWQQ